MSHDDLIKALNKDIEIKKKSTSFRNEMKFMPAITSWLSKGYYEAILEDLGNENEQRTNQGPRYEGEIE